MPGRCQRTGPDGGDAACCAGGEDCGDGQGDRGPDGRGNEYPWHQDGWTDKGATVVSWALPRTRRPTCGDYLERMNVTAKEVSAREEDCAYKGRPTQDGTPSEGQRCAVAYLRHNIQWGRFPL